MPQLINRLETSSELAIAHDARERASEVLSQLQGLKSNLVANLLCMGDLLLEVKQNSYHIISGYSDFQAWLDDSKLDMKISQAYYLMRIVSKTNFLDIPRSELEACNISALKEIASLDVDRQADEIRELVEYAKDHTIKETQSKVDAIKVANGQELYTLKGFRVPNSVLEDVIEPAIEQVRMQYGQTIDSETGEYIEISDGKALELICGDFLAGNGVESVG